MNDLKTDEPLKVGVIGVGAWGKNHARVYHELPEVELVGVCDARERNANFIARKFQTTAYTDPVSFLEKADLDVVNICTPTTTHYDLARTAIENDISVLVEKPVTSTVKEAVELRDLANKHKVTVAVGFIERFNQVTLEAKKLIHNNTLGKIFTLSGRRIGPFWPERVWDVGVVKDSAIHEIDAFRFILEKEPIQVYATGGSYKHKYEDHVKILLDFGEKLSGYIEANFLTPYKERSIMITGDIGVYRGNYQTQEITYETKEWVNTFKLPWKEPLRAELESFIHAVKTHSPPKATIDDGVKVLEICEAVLTSLRTGEPVPL